MHSINVRIERLIFDGLTIAPDQRRPLQAAVEAELARLLTEGGLPPGLQAGMAVPHVPAGAIQLTSDGNPTQLGQQIAQAVYRGIGK